MSHTISPFLSGECFEVADAAFSGYPYPALRNDRTELVLLHADGATEILTDRAQDVVAVHRDLSAKAWRAVLYETTPTTLRHQHIQFADLPTRERFVHETRELLHL